MKDAHKPPEPKVSAAADQGDPSHLSNLPADAGTYQAFRRNLLGPTQLRFNRTIFSHDFIRSNSVIQNFGQHAGYTTAREDFLSITDQCFVPESYRHLVTTSPRALSAKWR